MKKQTSLFKYLPAFIFPFIFLVSKKLTRGENELMVSIFIGIAVVYNSIKLLKFYKEANKTINVIWVSAISLMIAGGVAYYFFQQQIGLTIVAIGTIAFGYTLHYSFLENRPDLQ